MGEFVMETDKGLEIPVPSKDDFDAALKKAQWGTVLAGDLHDQGAIHRNARVGRTERVHHGLCCRSRGLCLLGHEVEDGATRPSRSNPAFLSPRSKKAGFDLESQVRRVVGSPIRTYPAGFAFAAARSFCCSSIRRLSPKK